MTVCLANLHMSSEQQIFDHVANHLLTQNRKAIEAPINACRYRVEEADGTVLKCAAGCLITDEEYAARHVDRLEGNGWATLYDELGLTGGQNQMHFIYELQRIHDRTDNVAEWPNRLRIFAHEHGLRYNEEMYGSRT